MSQTIALHTPQAGDEPSVMRIETSRFGTLEVEADRVLRFAGGLLGFPEARRFALIQTGEETGTAGTAGGAGASNDDPYFFWLQSADDPRLAFVVCDPAAFVPGYDAGQVPLRAECRQELGLSADLKGPALAEATQVLAICNRVGDWLTGNLLGPIVVNVRTFAGKQVVLAEKRWGTRHPLLRLGGDAYGIGPATQDLPLRKSA